MWDQESFDTLKAGLAVPLKVTWDKKASVEKYGRVNAFLAVLRVFQELRFKVFTPEAQSKCQLVLRPADRRLTDRRKRSFTIVGHDTGRPITSLRRGGLTIDLYFNYHFFVQAETTCRQYFPSASVILRLRNFLRMAITPSPGSWGSDIIGITVDWPGTAVIETAVVDIPAPLRRHFRGYKLVPAAGKLLLTSRKPRTKFAQLLRNNRFDLSVEVSDAQGCIVALRKFVDDFLSVQERRCAASASTL
jgi:hypothetical protein